MNNIFQKNGEILQFNGMDIYLVYNGNYVSSGILEAEEINEHRWSLTVNLQGEISLLFPSHDLDVLVGRELGFIDKKHDQLFCCGEASIKQKYDLLYLPYTVIDVPQFHLIGSDNETISVSYHYTCSIKSIQHCYSHYIQMTIITGSDSTSFYINRSYNYLVNLEEFHPLPLREINLFEPLSKLQLNESIYYMCSINKSLSIPSNCFQFAIEIQSMLSESNIKSVIIGGLSKRLNGIKCDIHDIDIMVDPQDFISASAVLSGCADIISHNNLNYRFNYNGVTIDLSNDNFNILKSSNYLRIRHGLTFLDLDGLMWFYLINYYNNSLFHLDIHKYRNSITQISNKLLLDDMTMKMYDQFNYNDNCIKILTEFSNVQQMYKDIRINKPLQVNSFKSGPNDIFAVINNGSTCDARLVIDSCPKFATWKDVSGREEELKIENHEKFSCIFIPGVNYPGYVVCTV